MHIRCAALIVEDHKALFLKYNYPNGPVFAIPGGGLELGETMPKTLLREYREEVGVTIEVGPILFTCETMAIGKLKQRVHLIFSASIAEGRPKLQPQHTTADDAVWLDADQIEQCAIYPNVGPHLASWLRNNKVSCGYIGDCTPSQWY